MAEIDDDSFSSIIANCRYSSSQEDFLTHSKFAGENAAFAGDNEKSTAVLYSGQSDMELSGKNVVRVEFEDVYTNCEEDGGPGFQKEKKRSRVEIVFDGEVRVSEVPETVLGSSIEPRLKKYRVSESNKGILKGEKASYLIQCNEKLVIDSEDKSKQIVVFRGGVSVEMGVDEHVDEEETSGKEENRAEKKFEFVEVVDIQNEGTIEAKDEDASSDVGNSEVGNKKGTENLRDGSIEEIERRKKRRLSDESRNAENRDVSGRNVEGNGRETLKTDETMKHHLLDGLKMLATYVVDEDETRVEEDNHAEKKLKFGNEENRDIGERNVEGNGGETLKTDETIEHNLLDPLKMLVTYDTDEDGMRGGEENQAEKKLKLEDDAEVVGIQDKRTDEANNRQIINDLDKTNSEGDGGNNSTEKTERQREHEDGNLKGAKNLRDDLNEEIERRKTHDLPRSLFRQTRGLSTNWSDGNRNEENRDRVESSKTDETLNHHLLYALKMLATRDADAGEVDIFETAKNRGMTFPCSRFLLDTKKN